MQTIKWLGSKNLQESGRNPGKSVRLRDIWIFHSYLMDTIEEFNTMFSPQLGIWIGALSLNVMTRLYDIWDVFAVKMTKVQFSTVSSLCVCIVLLIQLLTICHLTAVEVITRYCSTWNDCTEGAKNGRSIITYNRARFVFYVWL